MQRTNNSLAPVVSILAGIIATQDAVHADPILFTYSVTVSPETLGQPDALVRFTPTSSANPLDALTVGSIELFTAMVEASGGSIAFDPEILHMFELTLTDIGSAESLVIPMQFILRGNINGATWNLWDIPDEGAWGSAVIGGHLFTWSPKPMSGYRIDFPEVSDNMELQIAVHAAGTFGACCYSNGTCEPKPEAECGSPAGPDVYLGDGTSCTPNQCVPYVACCVFDVGCVNMTSAECDATPLSLNSGVGTSCSLWDICFGLTSPFEPAPPPFNHPRTRYLSFVTPFYFIEIPIRIDRISPSPAVSVGYLTNPDANGFAEIVPDPQFLLIPPLTLIHVSGCEITPGSTYELCQTMGSTWCGVGATLSTVPKPTGKDWGDLVGPFNGTDWPAPDGLANVNDVLAVVAYIRGTGILPHFSVVNVQAISSNDPCLNDFVNVGDLFAIVRAVGGAAYPFTTDPTQCPPCP